MDSHADQGLLLEREPELAALDAAIAAAGRGAGQSLVIEAQAGLGKTRLLEAAAEIVGSAGGPRSARFACGEFERQVPWVAAAGLLAGPLSAVPRRDRARLLNGAASAAAFLFEQGPATVTDPDGYEVIRGLFEIVAETAAQRPLVLLLDDAQWCDPASLRFLVYLQRRVPELAASLVLATRPASGETSTLLDRLATAPGTQVLKPGALGVESVTALVRHEGFADAPAGFGRACRELTSGNPFYLHELVLELRREHGDHRAATAALAAAAPASVARSVLVRLGQLAVPGTLELVRAAAVLGDGASLRHVSRLAALDQETLEAAADALAAAELLAPGEPVRFVHPLVRAAVYADIPAAQRARQHARAAALLEAEQAAPESIAVQLLRAPAEASAGTVMLLRTAAARAAARGAAQVAAQYLRRALDEPPPSELRREILLELARLEAALGDRSAAGRLDEALERATDRIQRGEILLELGWIEHHAGRFAQAAAAFERGLGELAGEPLRPAGDREAADERPELVDALEAGYVLSAMYDVTRAGDAQARVRAIEARSPAARGPAQRALLGQILVARAMAAEPHTDVLELARRLWDGGRLLAEEGAQSQTLWHVVGVLSWSDAYAEASHIVDLALEAARRGGSALAQARGRYARAWPRYWTGDLIGAEDDARAAIDIWRGGLETYLPAAVYWLVLALLERDMSEEARQALLAAGPLERWQQTAFAGFLLAASGHLAGSRGEPEQALAYHLECGRLAEQLHFRNPAIMPWRSQAALAARLSGDPDLARQLAGEEVDLARRYGAPRALGVAIRTAGVVEAGNAGLRLLAEAEAVLASSAATLEHGRALIELGAATRRAGQRAAARPYLKRGLEIAHAAGAATLARHAETELRAAGGRARRLTTTGPESLTASERRIAELAAAGHTNRHIARSLHISTKAVEWHLHQTYLKLGIKSRRALPQQLSADTGQGA